MIINTDDSTVYCLCPSHVLMALKLWQCLAQFRKVFFQLNSGQPSREKHDPRYAIPACVFMFDLWFELYATTQQNTLVSRIWCSSQQHDSFAPAIRNRDFRVTASTQPVPIALCQAKLTGDVYNVCIQPKCRTYRLIIGSNACLGIEL